MKFAAFFSLIAWSCAPAVLAQPTGTSAEATTTTSAAPSCTASLITKLCDYKPPEEGTAVASSGESHCWEYCDSHHPCSFVIFVAGNPYTGTGTCWLYPGEEYDESLGDTDCGNPTLSVFDKPVCEEEEDPTATASPCKATETPSAIAEICDYPPPDDDCFYDCVAAVGASNCLSYCAEAGCNYAVFVPGSEGGSQYGSGTCWMYPDGEFDKKRGKECSGQTEQYVYENKCPKPSKTTSSSSSSATTTGSDENETEGATADAATTSGEDAEDAAPTGISRNHLLAAGMAVLML